MHQVVVIGDSEAPPEALEAARECGRLIAGAGAVLICGGRGGIMEAASQGAKEAAGTVVAILPGSNKSEANAHADIIIPTGIGYARNLVNILSGDPVIVIGGGSGTISEIAYAWQFQRTILALGWIEGASKTFAGKQLDKRRKDRIINIRDMEEFAAVLRQHVPQSRQ